MISYLLISFFYYFDCDTSPFLNKRTSHTSQKYRVLLPFIYLYIHTFNIVNSVLLSCIYYISDNHGLLRISSYSVRIRIFIINEKYIVKVFTEGGDPHKTLPLIASQDEPKNP